MTEKRSDVIWETPPPLGQGRYDWEVIAEKLRTQPGEWAKVFDKDKTSIVNAIRQGKIKAIHPRGGFQIRTANNIRVPVRTCTLYMRYNPDRDEETPAPVKRRRRRKAT